jgi:predicted NUDIX family phosphoesterase
VIDELVYVVPRTSVIAGPGWHGIRTHGLDDFIDVLERSGDFRPRPDMEGDPDWKQIIPYVVLRDRERYFLMQRTRAGVDARLHDAWTIGVGGHVNPGDGGLLGGLRREWDEELVAVFEPAFEFVGLLNDDTTSVGAVHLGAVFTTDAAGRSVGIREAEKLAGRFADPHEVTAVADGLETWSRIAFEYFERVGVR